MESYGFRILDWPSNAADLNPIENVWALWKQRINKAGIKTSEELWNTASNAWNSLKQDPDIVNSLIQSMPRRLQAVVNNDGYYTRY